jgi:predicted XRE-type DNA-binding protein
MKSKTYKNAKELAKGLGLSEQDGALADLKANMTKEIIKLIMKKGITHQELANLSGVPRSAVTGIISGSLQKVTIDRLVRILNSLGKTVDFKLKKAA